jgi:spore coat polysaccharide biosynthesis predicted glycosyltransferase SpsG
MHVAIRADSGDDVSYGHLVRTDAVAGVLLDWGHEVTYATTNPEQVRESCPDGVATAELPDRDTPDPFLRWLEGSTVDVVYADAYPVGTDYQRAVRERLPLVVQIDDARETICADAVVNGNLYAPELNYEFTGGEPDWCLGSEYLPLRGEIREFAAREPPWRDSPDRAIVTFGGSDASGLTPTAARAFDGLGLRVDAVVGPGFSADLEAEVREAAAETDADVRVVRDPPDLPDRMFEADLAVSACGSTTYELLALGTPMVAVPVASNQQPLGRALEEPEVDRPLVVVGQIDPVLLQELVGVRARERGNVHAVAGEVLDIVEGPRVGIGAGIEEIREVERFEPERVENVLARPLTHRTDGLVVVAGRLPETQVQIRVTEDRYRPVPASAERVCQHAVDVRVRVRASTLSYRKEDLALRVVAELEPADPGVNDVGVHRPDVGVHLVSDHVRGGLVEVE